MTTDDEPLAALRQANLELRAQLAQLAPIAAKYHALCTVTPDLMLVLDQDGRYLEIAQTRGITPELIAQRLTTTIHETFPPDLVAEMLDAIRRTLATGRSTRLEYDVPYADAVQRHAAELTPLSATTVLWFARDVTSARQLERTERTLRTFETIVESSPDGVALVAPDGALAYTNSALRALLGRDPAALAASTLHDHVDPRAALVEALADALARGTWHGRMTLRRADGGERPCQLSLVRLQREHDDSKPTQLAAIARDLTPIIEAEQHRVALQEQIIAAQRSALRELSTPLLPLAPGILAMPLIGTLDRERANEVMETLLAGITAQRAHTALLDVTGVRTLDAHAADALVQVARAANLLGARVILTGIGPDIAQTLVQLDRGQLQGITARGTLQAGIAEALARAADRGRPT